MRKYWMIAAALGLATNPILSNNEVEPAIEGNVDGWLDNTAASGTFSKRDVVTWPAGTIPTGWSVTNLYL